MSELWAYCEPCGRWFYPEGASEDSRAPSLTCPVCATDADALAERPEQNA